MTRQLPMFGTVPLTPAETSDLQRLESIVRRGEKTFIEVGHALKDIRERRLYRGGYATFEAYCNERFGFGASRGRQLVAAAALATEMTETTVTRVTVPTERHVRALAPMVAEQGPAAAARLYESLERPTVERVREAVAEKVKSKICLICGKNAPCDPEEHASKVAALEAHLTPKANAKKEATSPSTQSTGPKNWTYLMYSARPTEEQWKILRVQLFTFIDLVGGRVKPSSKGKFAGLVRDLKSRLGEVANNPTQAPLPAAAGLRRSR